MGFIRFRKSIKLAPGVKLNVNKKSVSLTTGTRGLHHTVGTKGSRTTVGIPGTGLSYTSSSSKSTAKEVNKAKKGYSWSTIIIAVLAICFVIGLFVEYWQYLVPAIIIIVAALIYFSKKSEGGNDAQQ